MSIAPLSSWFISSFKIAAPTEADYHRVAVENFKALRYDIAAACLELLLLEQHQRAAILCNQALLVASLHLLGYCHLYLNRLDKSLECFLSCVRMGRDEDWQMVVQVERSRVKRGLPTLANSNHS
jgi:tetratricopeptide (TPR) repeat protein